MTVLGRTEVRVLVVVAVGAIAIAAYRSLAGRELWLWALVYGTLFFQMLVLLICRRTLQYGDSLPPKTPKYFESVMSPIWWRHFDAFLTIAAVAWISLLLATSIPSTPALLTRCLFWIMGMGPLVMITLGTLVELHFRRIPDKPA